jgi:very-short-patch-repair endonuclease
MTRRPDIHLARNLRQDMNAPEHVAWKALRGLRVYGFPVRRQHPIGGYVADFVVMSAHLVIEIDGSVHGPDGARQADAERQAWLEAQGWEVLRIAAGDAMSGDYVFSLVAEKLGL